MKKLIYLVLILALFLYCGPKQEKVERIIEDRIEVVINHLEPYKIKGDHTSLSLEKEFSIDTERSEMVELGLTDISGFDVDSNGNIFLRDKPESHENHFFKFDIHGKFVTSFGRNGQGPGEFEWPYIPKINNKDEITVSDLFQRKLVFFDVNGNFIKQIPMNMEIRELYHLRNGKHLIIKRVRERDVTRKTDPHSLSLYSSNFEEIKELDEFISSGLRAEKIDGTRMSIFTLSSSESNIYLGNVERGYEITVFDMEGNIIRKVRKQYTPVGITEEYKKSFLEMTPERIRDKFYFSKHMPPFQYLFADDKGYLFVMTYEKGENQNEYIYDIFNPDGCFIGRTNLDNYGLRQYISKEAALDALAKQNRIYYIHEKENGFKELVVCKMIWN